MIILKDYTFTQNFKFMPRSTNIVSMVFTDELTNTSTTINNPTLVTELFYVKFASNRTFSFLIDGHTYILNCFDANGVPLFRDKIMCTNQVIKDYTINNGDYVANTTTNEYVIYE